MDKTVYANKSELEGQGFVKKYKLIYKQSTLERYFAAGYLNYGNPSHSPVDRVSAGNRLYEDYYLGGLLPIKAVDVAKIRVDGSGAYDQKAFVLHHQDQYAKAIASIPAEFWSVVRRVVISDEDIYVPTTNRLDKKRMLFAKRLDLCRGLDRLTDFYIRNYKKI